MGRGVGGGQKTEVGSTLESWSQAHGAAGQADRQWTLGTSVPWEQGLARYLGTEFGGT